MLYVTPDLCSARFMLHCEPGRLSQLEYLILLSAIAVSEHVKDELAVIPCLLPAVS